jgi:GNAT superfamily N-acetyltransferase
MIVYERTSRFADAALALGVLSDITTLYPGFRDWYLNTAMPGVVAGSDLLLVARDGPQIVGVALGKRHEDETKLRCVRVQPSHAGRGVGLHLIDRALRALDCDKPLCTVPQELFDEYARPFVNRYGFSLDHVSRGMYRRGINEYVFNKVPND